MSTAEKATLSVTTYCNYVCSTVSSLVIKKLAVVQKMKIEFLVGNHYLDSDSIFWDVTVCSLVSRRSILLESAAFIFSMQFEEEIHGQQFHVLCWCFPLNLSQKTTNSRCIVFVVNYEWSLVKGYDVHDKPHLGFQLCISCKVDAWCTNVSYTLK
jgi:hypothetical protein